MEAEIGPPSGRETGGEFFLAMINLGKKGWIQGQRPGIESIERFHNICNM
jgi:hypothetical protein